LNEEFPQAAFIIKFSGSKFVIANSPAFDWDHAAPKSTFAPIALPELW
jgi:hypothetical protein